MSSATLAIFAVIGAGAWFLFFGPSRKTTPLPLPPGPPPKPIVGNYFDVPKDKPWIKYLEWSRKYNSDIIHMKLFNTHIFYVHSLETITELLDKRSRNYSSRPHNPMFKFIGVEEYTPFQPYGDTWRAQKRILKEGLGKTVIPAFNDLQVERAHLFLDLLIDEPNNIPGHCSMLGASVTMGILFAYDVDLRGKQGIYQRAAESGAISSSKLLAPGYTLAGVFSFLRSVPPWFPGATVQKAAAESRDASFLYRNGPIGWVKKNMLAGKSRDCVAARLMEKRMKPNGTIEDEETLKDALAGLYLAGVDTMKHTLNVFFLAMTLHPAVQKKAQEEIDRVVGSQRLPTFGDRPALPYIDAIFREVLRWRPVVPLGFVHTTVEDDVYNGVFIPKGAFVFPSTWGISRNEAVYSEPDSFIPDRFIKPDGTLNDDDVSYGFGHGRRVCSGVYLAKSMVWVAIASVLATFNIKKAKDENGVEIDIDPDAFEDGIATYPKPYKCSVSPRTSHAEYMIRHSATAARETLSFPDDE